MSLENHWIALKNGLAAYLNSLRLFLSETSLDNFGGRFSVDKK